MKTIGWMVKIMRHKIIISNKGKRFPDAFGFNELLDGKIARYNPRTRKIYYLPNKVKINGEEICCNAIRVQLRGTKIEAPIKCIYYIYARNKDHDRGNIYAGVEKIFLDSLQEEFIIRDDGWKYVLDSEFHTYVDRDNPRVVVEIIEVEK